MAYGRGEKEIGDALRERGLEVVPQVRVFHEQQYGHYYDVDLGLFPLAVEVHCDKTHPRYRTVFHERSSWLIRQGWAIAYVWLYKGHSHTEQVIDELVDFYEEVKKGHADRYRLYHWDGQLMERGGLEIEYYLDIDTGPWRKRPGGPADRSHEHGYYFGAPPPDIPDELKPPVPEKRLNVRLDNRPIRPLRPPPSKLVPVPGSPGVDAAGKINDDDEEEDDSPWKTDPPFGDPPAPNEPPPLPTVPHHFD